MAVKNQIVTHNATSAAADLVGSLFNGGAVKKIPYSFELAAADDDTGVYRIGRIPVTARHIVVRHGSDDITSGTDFDIGFYKPESLGGAAVDADAIADGLDYSGSDALTAIYPDPAAYGKTAWQYAGLSAKPDYGYFDIAITANTVGSAAGTLFGEIEYLCE